MTRRHLLLGLPAVALAQQQQSPENAFSEVYNEWITRRNAETAGTVDAQAARLWVEVRRCWHALERSVQH